MKTKVRKRSNNLAVRVQRGVVEIADIRSKYRLSSLVKRITAKNRYLEMDSGTLIGRELL